ncbi:BTB/POZ domain-containing protein 6-like [Mercenaria mercenaria]|uniref:BTB/POZ domain-containing protein 6-like n=1 Tax=Mercenaria mercenaria TaxID=6596 RepID=UPI00234FB320|nr:BTB/POZ domain-containing protein 6-like [Mercenaria mercenaria]
MTDGKGTHDSQPKEEHQQPTCIDWQQGKNLAACIVEMYDRDLWTDVKFHCKDHEEEKTIQAHKIVLAARSPVFQAMFFGPCADRTNEVTLKDTKKNIMLLFLRYIYSDTVSLTKETAVSLMEMAHCYQVSSLVHFCADFLATVITPDNACEILTRALLYELTSLKEVCCSFIDNHAQLVLKSEGFINLSESTLLYILKGDTLFAKEDEILEAAEKWSRRRVLESRLDENGTNIRTFLGQSFYQLRLPTMSHKSLIDNVSRKGYFSVEEYSDIAGYINKVPGISVSTNSCVTRLPEVETVEVNVETEHEVIIEKIATLFEITVSKDVTLANIVFSKLKPHLKDTKCLYTTERSIEKFCGNENMAISCRQFQNEVIKINDVQGRLGQKYSVSVLHPFRGDVLDNLDLPLSVSIAIEPLKLRCNFKLEQNKLEDGRVNLTPSPVLKKSDSPYVVQIDVQYSCGNGVQIKTRDNKRKRNLTFLTDNIKVQSDGLKKDTLVGIKSLGFVNFSNRVKHRNLE